MAIQQLRNENYNNSNHYRFNIFVDIVQRFNVLMDTQPNVNMKYEDFHNIVCYKPITSVIEFEVVLQEFSYFFGFLLHLKIHRKIKQKLRVAVGSQAK